MPVLVDESAVIYESAIINEYLEEKYSEPALMPKEPGRRALVRIWIDYANTRVQRAGGYIAHEYEVDKSKEELKQYLATLDRQMRDREYIAGDYSLADITYVPFFTRLARYQTTIDDSVPNVKAWMERLLARPTISATP